MLEKELQLERELFFSLNGSHSAFWDHFFYICSYPGAWVILYICFLWVFVYKRNWKETVLILIMTGLVVLFCDQMSSGFSKPFFQRFRPTHHPDFMDQVKTVFNYRGGSYGFISGHAANSFGLATFFALVFRNKFFTWTIFLYAVLISYSRIYLGVHFISDIIAGAVAGMLIGGCLYLIYNNIRRVWFFVESNQLKKPVYSVRESYLLCGVFYLSIINILIISSLHFCR